MGTDRYDSSWSKATVAAAANFSNLRLLVMSVREKLLDAPDSVCLERARLVTEAWQKHGHEPACLLRAHAFAHVLRNMTLDLATNPIFAGNTSSKPRALMLIPEHGFGVGPQVKFENDRLDGLVERNVPDDLRSFWDTRSVGGLADPGHLAIDLNVVVNIGLNELIRRIDLLAGTGTEEQQKYRFAINQLSFLQTSQFLFLQLFL